MSNVNKGDTIEIEFDSSPFAFDENNNIRCLKCHDAGWQINQDIRSGIDWELKKKISPPVRNDMYSIPENWSRKGSYNRDRLNGEAWGDMIREAWRQTRHLGKQRARYVGLFGGISVLGFLMTIQSIDISNLIKATIFLVLGLYTIVHAVIAGKMARAYEHNMDHIDLLTAIAPPEVDAGSFAALRPMKGMILKGKWRKIQLSRVVPLIYIGLAIIWLGLSANFTLIFFGLI